MMLWSRLRSWMRVTLLPSRMESEMDTELRFHLEAYAEDLIRSGVPRQEAMRRARLEFGGFERAKEECREARGATFMETLLQDLRYGVRTMLRAPGFTAIAVVALALGIGANAAIFSVVNAVLLRPLAYKDSARLVTILMNGSGPVAVANYIDWRDLSHSFKAMGAADYWSPNLTGIDSPEHIRGLKVTQSLFPMLGVEPLLGRLFVERKGGRPNRNATPRASRRRRICFAHHLRQRGAYVACARLCASKRDRCAYRLGRSAWSSDSPIPHGESFAWYVGRRRRPSAGHLGNACFGRA